MAKNAPCFIAVLSDPTDSPLQINNEYTHMVPIFELQQILKPYDTSERIAVITSDSNVSQITHEQYSDLVSIYVSNSPSFIGNDNVVYCGLTDRDSQDFTNYFTAAKIRQVGVAEIVEDIRRNSCGKLIHLIIGIENELQTNEIIDLIFELKTIGIRCIDIITNNQIPEITQYLIDSVFENTKKEVAEDTRFIIYRPVEAIDEHDIGWYILRVTYEELETYLKYLIDTIITIETDNEEVFITSTTVGEQNKKKYETCTNILDYCLFPHEKASMVFELFGIIL